MASKIGKDLLIEQIRILDAAAQVLQESHQRVRPILGQDIEELNAAQKESCEALTARFARLCDFLFQRAFRTLDKVELIDEGTAIDRLNRMEKRRIITSTALWKELREIRNQISHEYLIEKADRSETGTRPNRSIEYRC